MFAAAGGEPTNLIEGLSVSRKWNEYIKKVGQEGLAARGVSPQELIDNFVDTLPANRQEAARLSLDRASIAGFGRVGEAFAGVQTVGVLGGEARNQVSARLGSLLTGSRKVGNYLENHSRFILTYDGIKQGLSPDEAIARTKKYLVDYEDLSTLDENLKQIIPFWMWTSRNLPLQIESIWLNPRPYQRYMSLKRNIEDEDNTDTLPLWMREAGGFAISKGLAVKPDLGFPGAGGTLIEDLAEGDIPGVLSSLSPLIKVLPEIYANKKFFSGAPIAKEALTDKEKEEAKLGYAAQSVVTPLSTFGRLLGIIPGEETKALQVITGSRKAGEDAEGLATELKSLLSYIGSPVFNILPSERKNEILRRYYELQALKEDAKKERKKK
jgi:hypothetical protein